VGSASRGMVRRWGRFFSRVRPRVSQSARGGLIGATPRGQPWTSAVTLPHGRNGLSARRMAVLYTFREPSLCRHVHRKFMRSAWLDLTPIIPATACHQRNYVERYSRCMAPCRKVIPSGVHPQRGNKVGVRWFRGSSERARKEPRWDSRRYDPPHRASSSEDQ
jgi:hypothetical protein